jgi:hypothetical protein
MVEAMDREKDSDLAVVKAMEASAMIRGTSLAASADSCGAT